MTLRENEIANFVLKNPEFIVNNTITNIANEVGVSETSINRFCKKIGYKGFQDFKIAMDERKDVQQRYKECGTCYLQ